VQPLVVGLPEVDDVDVGLVDGLDVALLRVDAHRNGAVDAGHGNAVTGLNAVNLKRKKSNFIKTNVVTFHRQMYKKQNAFMPKLFIFVFNSSNWSLRKSSL
jgi:hypothetical protein